MIMLPFLPARLHATPHPSKMPAGNGGSLTEETGRSRPAHRKLQKLSLSFYSTRGTTTFARSFSLSYQYASAARHGAGVPAALPVSGPTLVPLARAFFFLLGFLRGTTAGLAP